MEIVNRDILERVPLLKGGGPVLLHNLAMMLNPVVYEAGETIIRQGEMGQEMYFISRGQAEAHDAAGKVLRTLTDGEFFGEISLLLAQPRSASVRAATTCDLFVLHKADFDRALEGFPAVRRVAARDGQEARQRAGGGGVLKPDPVDAMNG